MIAIATYKFNGFTKSRRKMATSSGSDLRSIRPFPIM